MANKFRRMVKCNDELLLTKLSDPSIMLFCKATWQVEYFVSTFNRPSVTKHVKVMTLREGLPTINSHNSLNMWSHEVICSISFAHEAYLHYLNAYGH